MIDLHDRWKPTTLAEPKPDPDPRAKPIPFVMTNRDRTDAAIVRCDIEAMQRRFRQPEGLEVGTATADEFEAARAEFRRAL